MEPPNLKSINPRMEIFTIRPTAKRHSWFQDGNKGKLFGTILVSDPHGICHDGWSPMGQAEYGYVPLFEQHLSETDSDCEHVYHNGFFDIGNPDSSRSFAFGSSAHIFMNLLVTTVEKDDWLELCNFKFNLNFSHFWDSKKDSMCISRCLEGNDADILLNYVLLRDAVDAFLEIEFHDDDDDGDRHVFGQILAYYGGKRNLFSRPSYMASIYRPDPTVLKTGKLKLRRSVIAVPKNGILVIKVLLVDCKTQTLILDDKLDFKVASNGCTLLSIGKKKKGECSVDVKVKWKYQDVGALEKYITSSS